MPTTNPPYSPEVQQGIGSLHLQYGKLLAELGLEMQVRPCTEHDGVVDSAWVAWSGRDRYYIAMDGEPVALS